MFDPIREKHFSIGETFNYEGCIYRVTNYDPSKDVVTISRKISDYSSESICVSAQHFMHEKFK